MTELDYIKEQIRQRLQRIFGEDIFSDEDLLLLKEIERISHDNEDLEQTLQEADGAMECICPKIQF